MYFKTLSENYVYWMTIEFIIKLPLCYIVIYNLYFKLLQATYISFIKIPHLFNTMSNLHKYAIDELSNVYIYNEFTKKSIECAQLECNI